MTAKKTPVKPDLSGLAKVIIFFFAVEGGVTLFIYLLYLMAK